MIMITEDLLASLVTSLKDIQKSAQSEVGSTPEGETKQAWGHVLANINAARMLVQSALRELQNSKLTSS